MAVIHNRRRTPAALLAAVFTLAFQCGAALAVEKGPASHSADTLRLDQVAVTSLPSIDPLLRIAEDTARSPRSRQRYAVPFEVSLTPDNAGTWEVLANGDRLWRLRVHAPGATDLSFVFTRFQLPSGSTLHIMSESRDVFRGPYGSADHRAPGEFWTPMVPGDRAVIELHLPARSGVHRTATMSARQLSVTPDQHVDLALGRVNRGYRNLQAAPMAGGGGRGSVGALCGDSVLDGGETCDDGNASDGDGCSSLCLVEQGFACSAPIPGDPINGVPDGGFEAGTPNPVWTESSTNFGTPLCNEEICGTGSGSGPNSGTWWLWFGGISLPEDSFMEQSLVLESADTVLSFFLEQVVCDGALDYARILIDGNEVFETTGDDPACGVPGYQPTTIDLVTAPGGPYNDDGVHLLRIESQTFAANGSESNFFFDDFTIDRGTSTPPTPSVCSIQPQSCQSEDFDPPLAGQLGLIGWTSFFGGDALTTTVWGTTDDGVCGSVNVSVGNFTGGAGEAACVDSDAAGPGRADAYLCSGAIDLSSVEGATLAFAYSYQFFGPAGPDDVFQALVGTSAPDALSVGGYTTVLDTSGVNQGTLSALPGAAASVDISTFDGAPALYVCFRYGGDFDWYAQVDDVRIEASECGVDEPDTDGDGVADGIDNCVASANADQRDTDGDGFGNVCDADLNNDCIVNPLDLGLFKLAFFTSAADPDFNGDGIVNTIDLGIFKSLFFLPPGPNGSGTCP